MSSEQLRSIDAQIARHKESIADGNALARLKANPDFKRIILSGYLEKEAVRLVHGRAVACLNGQVHADHNLTRIEAVSIFSEYLKHVAEQAETAAADLVDTEHTRDELLADPGE
jgi:hypothetical protein